VDVESNNGLSQAGYEGNRGVFIVMRNGSPALYLTATRKAFETKSILTVVEVNGISLPVRQQIIIKWLLPRRVKEDRGPLDNRLV